MDDPHSTFLLYSLKRKLVVRCISKLALVIVTTILAQPFCPALTLDQQPSEIVSAPATDCHGSLPEIPDQPQRSKTCCTGNHSQIAKPAMRYVSPQVSSVDERSPEEPILVTSQSGLSSREPLLPPDWRQSSAILRI